jgi:hypothetical protein
MRKRRTGPSPQKPPTRTQVDTQLLSADEAAKLKSFVGDCSKKIKEALPEASATPGD